MIKHNAASSIRKINDAINKLIISELERHGMEGLVPSHGDILAFLYQKNGLSVKELAEKIHRTQPTVTVLVNKLEKLGYAQRIKSEEDSRIHFVKLTEKGVQLQPKFMEISQKLNEVLYGGFDDAQREHIECLLADIYKRF